MIRRGASAVTAALMLFSCAQRVERGTVREVPLIVVFAAPLRSGAGVPEELVQLSLAVQDSNCPTTAFLPKIQLSRLDVGDVQPAALAVTAQRDWIGRLQDFYGQNSLSRVNRDVERAVHAAAVPPELLKPATLTDRSDTHLAEALEQLGARQLFVLDDGPTIWPATFRSLPVASAKTGAELSSKIAAAWCESEKAGGELLGYVVLVKPPASALGVTPTHRVAAATQPRESGTPMALAPTPRPDSASAAAPRRVDEDANERFASLERDVRSRGAQDRRRLDELLKAAQNDYPHDYRFAYLRAQLAVYGRSAHHDAFEQLFHAAEVAITNDDAELMLRRITEDSDHDGPLHKLAHGHGEWQTLLAALRRRNAMLVRR